MLAGSEAFAQLLAILASPVITRLYSPAEFGLLAQYMALVGIIAVIACARYDLAIALPEKEREGANVAFLAIAISCLVALFCLLIVLFFKWEIAAALNTPELEIYLYFLPLSIFLIGFYNACRYWAIREDRYATIGKTRLTQVVGSLVVQIGGAGFGVVALFVGQITSQSLGVYTLGRHLFTRRLLTLASIAEFRNALIRYKRFPLFSTWSALLNTSSTELPTLFLAISFGPASAGFYALSSRVLRAPVTVISGSIASVFLSGAAKAKRHGNLSDLTVKTYSHLVSIAMPLMFLLAVVAPDLFSFVFSEIWYPAGIYARWMTIWIFLVFVTSPLHFLFSVMERQDAEFVYQMTLFITRVIALSIGISMGSPVATIALFCTGSAICQLGFIVWMQKTLSINVADLVNPFTRAVGWSLLVSAPVLTYLAITPNLLLFMFCLAVSGVLMFFRFYSTMKIIKNMSG